MDRGIWGEPKIEHKVKDYMSWKLCDIECRSKLQRNEQLHCRTYHIEKQVFVHIERCRQRPLVLALAMPCLATLLQHNVDWWEEVKFASEDGIACRAFQSLRKHPFHHGLTHYRVMLTWVSLLPHVTYALCYCQPQPSILAESKFHHSHSTTFHISIIPNDNFTSNSSCVILRESCEIRLMPNGCAVFNHGKSIIDLVVALILLTIKLFSQLPPSLHHS